MQVSQDNAKKLICDITLEWKKKIGHFHGDLLEYYKCEGAEYILISMGAIGAESKVAINNLQKNGYKIGLARLRAFRPFPKEEIIKVGKNADLIVIDRNISIGLEGALFNEVKGALYGQSDAKAYGYIAGLGGKDVTYKDIETMCKKAIKGKVKNHQVWYGFEEV
jgi:pyruvate/2-oxoacid:ferredoxin oxidoreductase alpha subunit